jgi:hypothetical protein
MSENKLEDMLRAFYVTSQSKAILDDLILNKELTFNEVLNVLANALKIVMSSVVYGDNDVLIDDKEVHEILQNMIEQVETGVKFLKGVKKNDSQVKSEM